MPVLAAIFFGIAILMHLFGWSHGRIDWILFALLGLLCMALPVTRPSWWPARRPGNSE